MNIVLLGKPGAGKGFVADILKEYGLYHISTGNLCRKNIKDKTALGLLAEKYTVAGKLVPLDIILKMFKQELLNNKAKGYIFDGFPRNVEQANELAKIADVDKVLFVDVPNALILERISKRRVCKVCSNMSSVDLSVNGRCPICNGELTTRADDDLTVAKNRIELYEKETKPLLDYYSNLIVRIDNSGSQKDTRIQVEQIFNN